MRYSCSSPVAIASEITSQLLCQSVGTTVPFILSMLVLSGVELFID
jgi:hypothetical protein